MKFSIITPCKPFRIDFILFNVILYLSKNGKHEILLNANIILTVHKLLFH